jgi:hypothetical protein
MERVGALDAGAADRYVGLRLGRRGTSCDERAERQEKKRVVPIRSNHVSIKEMNKQLADFRVLYIVKCFAEVPTFGKISPKTRKRAILARFRRYF